MFSNVFSSKNQKYIPLTVLPPISQNGQTLKQFVGNLPTNCLSVFDHFVGLARKGFFSFKTLRKLYSFIVYYCPIVLSQGFAVYDIFCV